MPEPACRRVTPVAIALITTTCWVLAGCDRAEDRPPTTDSHRAATAVTEAEPEAEDAPASEDGPFGIVAGSPISSFKNCERKGDLLRCLKVPRTHPAFERYDLKFGRESGVCQVGAIGKTIRNDAYGNSLRQAADELASQIESKYGSGYQKYDFLASGSIWNEPDEWTMAVAQNERVYSYIWSAENGYVPKDRVEQLAVIVSGMDRSDGWVGVIFEFDNFDACKAEQDAAQSEAF